MSYLNSLGLCPLGITPCVDAVHIFTHIEWHMTGYAAECLHPDGKLVWESADDLLSRYAIPSAFRAYVEYIKKFL